MLSVSVNPVDLIVDEDPEGMNTADLHVESS